MGNPPVAPETTALGHPRFGAVPGLPDVRRAHPFHTVRACAANPLHRERLLSITI